MAGGGVFSRVISAARRTKSQRSGRAPARTPEEQTQVPRTQAQEKPLGSLRLAEALLILEESYNGTGARDCLTPEWTQSPTQGGTDLQLQPAELADGTLLISGPAAGMASFVEQGSQEGHLLKHLRPETSLKGETVNGRHSDPSLRARNLAEHGVFENQDRPTASKPISGQPTSSGPLPDRDALPRDSQSSGRYAPGRLWRKETEQHVEPQKAPAYSSGAASTMRIFASEPETLALWQAGPEDSAQVALSPPRRECWNVVYHHTQSVGNPAFSPVSENNSLRSQCSAEEVSSSQRPIEEAEEEQRRAAAAGTSGSATPVACESPVVNLGHCQSRLRANQADIEEAAAPQARKLTLSGPLCFPGVVATRTAPAARLGFSMPLLSALPPEATATDACQDLFSNAAVGEWNHAAASHDCMVLEGCGEAREEVGEGEGPCLRMPDQECEDYRAWYEGQVQLGEQFWRPEPAPVGTHGRCMRTYSEELKGTMEEDRPEDLFLSGPLVQQTAAPTCGTSQCGNGETLSGQQETLQNPLLMLEKSESGTRNGGRFSKYTDLDMEWESEDCVWDRTATKANHLHQLPGSAHEGDMEIGSRSGGKFAAGAYDPVYY